MNVLKSYRNRIIYLVCAVFIIVLSCVPVISVRAGDDGYDTSYPHTDSTYKYYLMFQREWKAGSYDYAYIASKKPIVYSGGFTYDGYYFDITSNNPSLDKRWKVSVYSSTGNIIGMAYQKEFMYKSNHDIKDGNGKVIFQGAQTPETPENPDRPVNPDTSWTESLGSVFLKILILVIGGMLLLISLLMLVKRLVTWFRRYLTA